MAMGYENELSFGGIIFLIFLYVNNNQPQDVVFIKKIEKFLKTKIIEDSLYTWLRYGWRNAKTELQMTTLRSVGFIIG